MTSTRCSACGGWSCERRRLHAAVERATLLEHQRRKTPRTSCDEVSPVSQETPRRATNPKTGGRPSQFTAGTNPKTGQASRYVFNPDGVFESCDARLRHVGGQFTVLDGNVSEVSSMSFTMRCWSPAVRSVVLGNTLAEVRSWTALSWCLRSW